MDANSFSTRIRRSRMASGLQGKELAMRLGISRPYLTQIEKGDRKPANELLIRLAHELKVTPHWLVHGSHPEKEEQPAPEKIDLHARISDLERQLAVANETINNLSKALAEGRAPSLRPPHSANASTANAGGKKRPA